MDACHGGCVRPPLLSHVPNADGWEEDNRGIGEVDEYDMLAQVVSESTNLEFYFFILKTVTRFDVYRN
jgi:hypothetical protein